MLSESSPPTSPLFSNHSRSHPMPPYTSFRDARQRVRDSIMSGTSSSIYPFSVSTTSGTDSPPSPRSLVDLFPDHRIASVDPDESGDDYRTFNVDDVSYRLRLLMNNSYFLPPAHSKPKPSDLAPMSAALPKKQSKSSAPAFFDLFRVGKARSKPGSPLATSAEDRTPVLRTTSDSITASGWTARPHAYTLPHSPASALVRPQERVTRVAVVREKMDDLVVAARQAEQEIKSRGEGLRSGEMQRDKADIGDDVIDPTDSVDVPPPSADSPFAVQASNVHGLGIEDSVGAALLAERLPPASPGIWSTDTDDDWRKALLHAAVGHSLNSPGTSSMLASPALSTPPRSSTGSADRAYIQPTVTGTPRRNLEQRIVEPEALVQATGTDSRPSTAGRNSCRPPIPKEARSFLAQGRNDVPRRAETPSAPAHPLAPPPRKQIINPIYSLSQSDLPYTSEEHIGVSSRSSSASRGVRQVVSSPALHHLHEMGLRAGRSVVSPPLPSWHPLGEDRISPPSREPRALPHTMHRVINSLTSGSHYSSDERDVMSEQKQSEDGTVPRTSFASTLPSRPSLSEYSQPSPTVSAFQDALFESEHLPLPMPRYAINVTTAMNSPSASSATSVQQTLRQVNMSPPPRASSSLSATILSPPPRTTSQRARSQLSSSPRPSFTSSDPGHSAYASAPESIEIHAPEPITPPFPTPSRQFLIAERRGNTIPTTLHIPTSPIPQSIRSAPPTDSSIDFFDHIQTHPNAMDDLDDSSESEFSDDGIAAPSVYSSAHGQAGVGVDTANLMPPLPAQTSIMRLGNHSTPYVSSSASSVANSPMPRSPARTFDLEERRPVGNIPPRTPYFKRMKGEQGVSNLDLHQLSRSVTPPLPTASAAVPARPSTSAATTSKRPATSPGRASRSERETESLKRLDGLLIQHMEAERDRLIRIARTAKVTART